MTPTLIPILIPVLLPETNVICYILGSMLIAFGLISFFPKLAAKVLRTAPPSRTAQIAGAIWCLVIGIGLILLGLLVFQNG